MCIHLMTWGSSHVVQIKEEKQLQNGHSAIPFIKINFKKHAKYHWHIVVPCPGTRNDLPAVQSVCTAALRSLKPACFLLGKSEVQDDLRAHPYVFHYQDVIRRPGHIHQPNYYIPHTNLPLVPLIF